MPMLMLLISLADARRVAHEPSERRGGKRLVFGPRFDVSVDAFKIQVHGRGGGCRLHDVIDGIDGIDGIVHRCGATRGGRRAVRLEVSGGHSRSRKAKESKG